MKCANMLSLPKKKKMYMFFHFQIELRYLVNVVAFQFQRLLNFRGMYCSTKDMIGVPRIMSQQLSMVIWHLTESTKQDNEHIFWHCFFVRSLWKAIFHRFSSLCFCPLHRRAVLVGNPDLFFFFFFTCSACFVGVQINGSFLLMVHKRCKSTMKVLLHTVWGNS
jgi:hypothetical protein